MDGKELPLYGHKFGTLWNLWEWIDRMHQFESTPQLVFIIEEHECVYQNRNHTYQTAIANKGEQKEENNP